MIERIYELIEPSLEGLATVVIYGIGIAVALVCIICMVRLAVNVCDAAEGGANRIKKYLQKRKAGFRTGWHKRISDLLIDSVSAIVSKVLAELVNIANARKEEAASNTVDLRSKICGWWEDGKGSLLEIYAEKGIYLMKVWYHPDDTELVDKIFSIRAPFSSGLNSNLFTAISDEVIDFFYGVEDDVIYVCDFQKMYERLDPSAPVKEDDSHPGPFDFDDLPPIENSVELDPKVLQSFLDTVNEVDDKPKKDDKTDGINMNIIE